MSRVLKFGGTSVATAERIRKVVSLVSSYQAPVVVVISALGGVTDELIRTAESASRGDDAYHVQLTGLTERHSQVASALSLEVREPLRQIFSELDRVLQGVFLLKELSKRSLDEVMSFGERLSALLVSHAFGGLPVRLIDARDYVITDNNFGSAKVDFAETNRRIASLLPDNPLVIVTGFIGRAHSGETTTLGRGGSDYTAAIFAAALQSSEIEIWTDVDGMLTADPRKVKKAFALPHVSYAEALELCHFGAKVIYPPTLQPAIRLKIPIWIKNTFHPELPGTLISSERQRSGAPITGISSIDRISLLRVQGSGMVGVTGVSHRLFGALAREKVNVILITQASSEHTICFAVDPNDSTLARRSVDREFHLERQAGLLDDVVVEEDLSIVSVVGENMCRAPGIAGRVFHALGRNGVNVMAIAQGSSELNISFVVDAANERKALIALHDAFFLSDVKTVNLFLYGTGLIGKTLLKQVAAHAAALRERLLLELRLVGISSSSKLLIDDAGLAPDTAAVELTSRGESCEKLMFVERIGALRLPNSIVVDCTASEEVVAQYEEILNSNIPIVTPNKKAQSGEQERFVRLKKIARKRGVEFLYETSVGAALPVIGTLNDLIRSGDSILAIEAVLSGTLSFIFNSLSPEVSFSKAVLEARARGLTEPDPRDDLNGLDVARKILILVREAGAALELNDVQLEALLPPELISAPTIDEFLSRLGEVDAEYARRIGAAASVGGRLFYVAKWDGRKASITLEQLGPEHPFSSLSGSDNIISFTTERYRERPLVVKGPGAGAEVTAAGVFADIIRIANYLD